MAIRCSRSGCPMSATRPHSKREINRSSSPGISFGGRSEVSTICLCPSNSALNVWKNSSWVISFPSRKCTSSTRKRSTSLRYRRRNSDMVRVNRFDDFVDELLGAEVVHPRARILGEHGMGDRLHQMRLAESRGAVDKERIVRLAGCFRDRVRGRGGELVRLPDHEGLERIPLVERRGRDARLVEGRRLARRHEEVHLGSLLAILLYSEHDRRGPPEHPLGRARQDAGVLRLVPFDGELIRGTDDQATVVQRDRHRWLEPRPHGGVGQFAPRLVEESLPSLVSRLLNPRLTRRWDVQQGRPETTRRLWKSQP